jgi:antitoxin (DNA-binding transcriptional repressor) of toxin-antitoxin stability system
MTTRDHNKVMKRPVSRVGVAELKAHLSAHLRSVRGGRTLTVVDRETAIAKIVPYDSQAPLEMRRATRRPSEIRAARPPSQAVDSLAALLEDRAAR